MVIKFDVNCYSLIFSSLVLLMQNVNLHFFIKHFFTSPILYEGSTVINLGFLIKKDLKCGLNFKLHRL